MNDEEQTDQSSATNADHLTVADLDRAEEVLRVRRENAARYTRAELNRMHMHSRPIETAPAPPAPPPAEPVRYTDSGVPIMPRSNPRSSPVDPMQRWQQATAHHRPQRQAAHDARSPSPVQPVDAYGKWLNAMGQAPAPPHVVTDEERAEVEAMAREKQAHMKAAEEAAETNRPRTDAEKIADLERRMDRLSSAGAGGK
jgi:hypothetical protein